MHIHTDPEDSDFVASMELQKRPVTEDHACLVDCLLAKDEFPNAIL